MYKKGKQYAEDFAMLKKKIPILCAVILTAVLGAVYNAGETQEENNDIKAAEKNVTQSADLTPNGEQNLNFDINAADEKYYSLSANHIGWGFKKNKGAPPDIDQKTIEFFGKTNTYYMASGNENVMYLTFDEGYENGCTASILDTLKEKDVKAAFFITGHYLKSEQELVRRMIDEGHIVGNHTMKHPNLAKSDLSAAAAELKALDDEYSAIFGGHMIYMRPPEGEYSERLLTFASDMGYKTVLWSFAYRDWERDVRKGADYAYSQIVPYFHSGAIILLHAVSADNAEALGAVIDAAREQGYVFKSLDELN